MSVLWLTAQQAEPAVVSAVAWVGGQQVSDHAVVMGSGEDEGLVAIEGSLDVLEQLADDIKAAVQRARTAWMDKLLAERRGQVQLCRHRRTLVQGCRECLSPDDWHLEEAPID